MTTLAAKNHQFHSGMALAAMIFLALTGCYGTPGRGGISQGRTGMSGGDFSTENPYGFEGVKEACRYAGGNFLETEKRCECPAGKGNAPQLFSAASRSCAPLEYKEDLCPSGGNLLNSLLTGGISELNRGLQGIARFERTNLSFDVAPSTSVEEAKRFADYIDRTYLYTKLWRTPDDFYFNSSVKVQMGNVWLNGSFIEQIVAPPPITQRARYQVTYLEPSITDFLQEQNGRRSLLPPPREIVARFPSAVFIADVYKRLSGHGFSSEAKVGGDCRRFCELEELVEARNGLEARHVRYYLGGAPFRELIKIRQDGREEPLAHVQLTPWGSLSSILFVTSEADTRRDRLLSHFEVFNRYWQKVGDETIELGTRISGKLKLLEEVPIVPQSAPGAVVLCESIDLEQTAGSDLLPSFLRRPSAIDFPTLSGSLFGWLSNGKGSASRFMDAAVELRDGVWPEGTAVTHGIGVAKTIISANSDVQLIPISMPNCTGLYDLWSGTVASHAVRVVNLSGTEPIDRRWCENFRDPYRLLGHDKPFLWVAAAGNEGKENPAERCPQNVGPADNLLVVAGNSGGYLWEHSDYGAAYADLVASVESADGPDLGTSYASARVSGTASKIASLYPNLKPGDIRNSILLGVYVPGYPLPVRSGGSLDEPMAMKIAKFLASLPVNNRNLGEIELTKIFSDSISRQEIQTRIILFKERNLIK